MEASVHFGTKKQASDIVEEEAKRCSVQYVNRRWLGGMLTNFDTIRVRINRLKELESMRDTGEFYRRPKKAEAKRVDVTVIGIIDTNGNPDDVDYVIPGNDDSIRSIKLITSIISDVILSAESGEDFKNDNDDDGGGGPDLQPAGVPRLPGPRAGELEISLLEEFEGDER